MKKYFAYTRVSDPKQGKGVSLEEQRAAIESHAASQGFEIVEWFRELETAAKHGRDVFSRMLKKIDAGAADGLIIHKIDRSARNLKDWAKLGELIDSGIDVQFAHDKLDLRTRGGRLSADIQAVVAADFIRNLRDEVKKGFYGRLKQGIYPLPAPIGYLDMGAGQPKALDPDRAPLVREMFELYGTGTASVLDVRREMIRRGLRSKNDKLLGPNAVSVVLNNPFYIGLIRIKRTGETFQGQHPPLVSKALFDRVQSILRGKTVSKVLTHDFPFRRLVRCERCGHHLTGERQKGRYVYYRCHGEQCKGTSIREELLDDVVQKHLRLLIGDDVELREIRDMVDVERKHSTERVGEQRAALEMRIGKCNERLARLTDALIDLLIDKEAFNARKEGLLRERRQLLDELEMLSASDLPLNKALEKLELGNAAYSGYRNGILTERREIVERLTSNFSVQEKNLAITLKSPFQQIADWRESQNSAPHAGTVRTRAKQLLDIIMGVDTGTISPVVLNVPLRTG